MSDRAWEKYGALGVVWFAVFGLVGGFLSGSPPSRTDPAAEISEYFVDNDTTLQVGAFLTAIALLGLAWFFGSLWRAMVRAEGSPRLSVIALVGFVISATMAMIGFGIQAATAAGIEHIADGTMPAFLFGLSAIFLGLSPMGDVIMIGAVTGLAWRTGFLPSWLTAAGALVVIMSLVSSGGVASDAQFFAVFGIITFLMWLLFVLAVGAHLFRNAPEPTADPAPSEVPAMKTKAPQVDLRSDLPSTKSMTEQPH